MATASFRTQLAEGQAGESTIATYLRAHYGYSLLPAYEKIIDNGKGPRVFTPGSPLVAPDFFVLSHSRAPSGMWIEAKTKSIFVWYAKNGTWQTGVDERHFHDYCTIADRYAHPVYLMFLHLRDKPDRPPKYPWPTPTCETGLFTENLARLRQCVDHVAPDDSGNRMVYWRRDDLRKIAELSDIATVLRRPV